MQTTVDLAPGLFSTTKVAKCQTGQPPPSRLTRAPHKFTCKANYILSRKGPPPQPTALLHRSYTSLLRKSIPANPNVPPPGKGRTQAQELMLRTSILTTRGQCKGVSPFVRSAAPINLTLKPSSPESSRHNPKALNRPTSKVFAHLSLLVSTFSLP